MAEKKYYWLKLKKDFFKRHDIKIIEAMPNGKDYVLFYLKLLLESLDHDGSLRFSDTIPYNENMLATVTDTNIDVVRNAMKLFTELNLIDVLEDSTIFMSEVDKMLGSEGWSAERVRNYRVKALQCNTDVTNCNTDVTKSKSKSKSKSIEIDNIDTNVSISNAKSKFGEYKHVLLTDEQYQQLKAGYKNADELIKFLDEYIEMKGYKAKSHYLAIKKWVVNAVSERNARKPQSVSSSPSSFNVDEIEKLEMEKYKK